MTSSPSRPGFPWLLSLFALAALALLIGLGSWQVDRMRWKEGLISASEDAANQPPVPLDQALAASNPEFRRVLLTCRGLSGAPFVELQAIEQGEAGVRLISACPIDGAGVFLVDRGFVPAEVSARPAIRTDDTMPVALMGVLRRTPAPGAMTPAPANGRFYGRDAEAMAEVLGVSGPVSPFTVFAVTSSNPMWTALKPSAPPAAFSNNHLGYALTWFGLALTLVVFYVVLLRRRLSRKDPS